MKMRKIISFVLVLALVLGSFSMAFAATPATGLSDIAGNANEDAIQVNVDLEIITGYPDGTFGPEKTVTRAEFAAMITRALAIPESALAGYSATSFKDMTGYAWATGYIGFCASKGIMLGDGMGNAMPSKTITVNEAMTMVLRAIGYVSNSAELVGTWPANYVTVAQNLGLYDDVTAMMYVDRANAAQIIYNILTVQKVAVNTDGETKYLTLSGTTDAAVLLNTGLGCDTTPKYTIDGSDYDVATINITKYMGAYGTAYFNDGDLVAFDKSSTALTGKMDGTKFEADGVDYSLGAFTISSTAAVTIENAGTDTSETLTNMLAYADTKKVTLNVDLSGKTIKEVYSVVAWKASDADMMAAADLEDISDDSKLLGNDFVTDDDDVIDTNQFELIGATGLDAIAKDDVVYVYADDNTVRKVAVGTEVVTGNVGTEGSDYIKVNGTKYEQADVTCTTAPEALPTLDQDVDLYLDAYGYVYASDATGGDVDQYAVVKTYATQGAFDNAKVKVYAADDATKTLTFVENDDITQDTTTTILATGELMGYALDADGYIDTLDNNDVTEATAVLKSTKVLQDGTAYLDINSDVVVFTYSTTGAIVTYDMTTIGNVDLGAFTQGIRYMTNDDGVAAMLVYVGDTDNATDDVYGVINTEADVKDGTDTVQELTGFIDGTAFTKLTTTTSNYAELNGLNAFTLDADGKVKLAATYAVVTGGNFYITQAGISTDGTVFTANSGAKFTVESDAVVYEAIYDGATLDSYEVADLSDIDTTNYVYLYDTKTGTDANGIATVIIFTEYTGL